jgi:hypothetical protein
VTAAQLAQLAELAAFAADYFARIDPNAGRIFGDTALRADILSTHLRREESNARHGIVVSVSPEGCQPSNFPSNALKASKRIPVHLSTVRLPSTSCGFHRGTSNSGSGDSARKTRFSVALRLVVAVCIDMQMTF